MLCFSFFVLVIGSDCVFDVCCFIVLTLPWAYNKDDIAFTLGWTINGKNNTETNFVVGVTMARVYVAEYIYINGRRKAKLI